MASGPDEGFAWVIALACFFINFIMAGLARTAGVIFVAVIDLYGISREAATTPFSIRVCVRNMTGPMIGLLGQKYGIRGVSVIGGFVAAFGCVLCYFSPNIFWMTMFWGVIHGLGMGLSTVLHMLAVGQYFDKYKASALGLGYSGDCFGTFAFPVIIEYLISIYDIRGTFLIIGGIVLNVVPMAMLLRKPPWIKEHRKRKLAKSIERKGNMPIKQKILSNVKDINTSNIVKNALNENESFERINNEIPLVKLSLFKKNFKSKTNLCGHCNQAFESSEIDIRSCNDEGDVSPRENTNQESLNGNKIEKLLTVPSYDSGVIQNSNIPCQPSEAQSVSLTNTNCKTVNAIIVNDPLPHEEVYRTIRSVSDLSDKNQYVSCISKCNRFSKMQNLALQERRDSLPPVLERELSLTEKKETSNDEGDNTHSALHEMDISRVEGPKKRTQSFVGQVAHEIVHRMRAASFVSQVAQDGFVTAIPQDCEDSEPESECELRSIVEHIDHDVETCTNKDLIVAVDNNMADGSSKDVVYKQNHLIHDEQTSVLKNLIHTNTKPIFILISISMAVYAFLFVALLTIIIDYAEDLGVPQKKGKYLIIGFSIADLFGRLCFGQVLDRNMMKMKNYFGCSMSLMGALVAVIPLNVSFNYMMVCMCMYGLVQGGTAIVFPILINMYMDKNSESVAMGCVNFYGGLLMLLMAPMIGYFRDNTGSYNYVFYITGGVTAIVGIIWQFEPMIIKYQKKKLREKYIMKEMVLNNARQ